MSNAVVFDFDGVIHSYVSGWQGMTVITDPPVNGIREAIADIRRAGYEVIVVSARCADQDGLKAVEEYLERNDIKVHRVCKEKPQAKVYIDDRALHFDGHAETLLEKIDIFTTWREQA